MVRLVCGKKKCEVSEIRAQSILQIQKEMKLKGWSLPNNSPYEFKDNALIKRADNKDCKGKKKSKGDPGGSRPSGTVTLSHGDDSEEG